ncbi:MAG: cobalamin biosynthesis protein [Candidatus Bathyarchaeota archaeon]|nr:cobalamin biosynthesis protein [Candidatus Bathyarchaeota archaeon]
MQFLTTPTFICSLSLLVFALALDVILGEYPLVIHPTVWIGKLVTFLERGFKVNGTPKAERVGGILLALTLISLLGLACYLTLHICYQIHILLFFTVGVFLLKSAFAIKSMREHVTPIVDALSSGDIVQARTLVSRIVSRDTSNLDEKHLISATVESIAENTVDGVTSPLFYFSFFGPVGAFIYRVINTLDSMVGYKNARYLHFGWFSATLDTVVNVIPARITAYLMVFLSIFIGRNFKLAYEVFSRYRSKTGDLNSGWPIAAMAGVLNVQLEKPNTYRIGESLRNLSVEDIRQALKVMYGTILLFVTLVVIPILILVSLI